MIIHCARRVDVAAALQPELWPELILAQFSHDLNVGRKVDKADIYTDARADDTMDKWDDAKLKSVVLSKHGNAKTTTECVGPSAMSLTRAASSASSSSTRSRSQSTRDSPSTR